MEGRKVIDTNSNVVEDLRDKAIDDVNVRKLIDRLYKGIEILDRYELAQEEYDEVDIQRIFVELRTTLEVLNRDIRNRRLDKTYRMPNDIVGFLIVLFCLICANLQTYNTVSREDHQKLLQSTASINQILKEMYTNPNAHRFYSVFRRDGKEFGENIDSAIEHFESGEYAIAQGILTEVLGNIRGAVRES